MKYSGSLLLIISFLWACNPAESQKMQAPLENKPRLVGGPCEGCEAVLGFGNQKVLPVDTLPGFDKYAPKLKIHGTIYQEDGQTPAPGVVLYVYQTTPQGLYQSQKDAAGWAGMHGDVRQWLKTDAQGHYTFYTFMPGKYPDGTNPAHIHPIILEPNGRYYWLDAYYFEGDILLSTKETSPKAPRGGSIGVLKLHQKGGIQVGQRDFILGKNIPSYN